MITNEPNTVNSFYSNNTGLSQLDTPKPSIFHISSWSFFSWLIFFIVLALLGFNVFVFLAKGSMTFVDFFTETVNKILDYFVTISSPKSPPQSNENQQQNQEENTPLPSSSPSTTQSSFKIEASKESGNAAPTPITEQDEQQYVGRDSDIMNVLQREKANKLFSPEEPEKYQKAGMRYREQGNQRNNSVDDEPSYDADDSYSSIQMSKSSSKSGWCFIGEDRGFRSCIRVGENSTCMSGDIFPSEENCVNPNLRF